MGLSAMNFYPAMPQWCQLICGLVFVLFPHIASAQDFSPGSDYALTSDSVRLFTKQSGAGPVCIFIHGGPGAWSRSFEDLGGSNLESRFTMVYYDQRGCGRSEEAKNDDYSLDRMVADIEAVREKYQTDSVYLMAHSFGGILAVNYALRHPAHIRGIILVNATLNMPYSLQHQVDYMSRVLKTEYKITDTSALISVFKEAQADFIKQGLIYKLLSDNKEHVALLNEIDSDIPGNFAFAQKALFISDYLQDFMPLTSRIETPVLVITGIKDHAIGPEHFRSFRFPNPTIEQINGGHLLYYEHNKAFINSVFGFLNRHK